MEWNSSVDGTAKRVSKNGQSVYVAQQYQPNGDRFAAFRIGRPVRNSLRFALGESPDDRRRARNARKQEAR